MKALPFNTPIQILDATTYIILDDTKINIRKDIDCRIFARLIKKYGLNDKVEIDYDPKLWKYAHVSYNLNCCAADFRIKFNALVK